MVRQLAFRRLLSAGCIVGATLWSAGCVNAVRDPTTLSFVSSESSEHLLVRYSPDDPSRGRTVVVDLPAGSMGTGLLSPTAWTGRLEILTEGCVVTGSLRVGPATLHFTKVTDAGMPVEVTSADVLDATTEARLRELDGICAGG